MDWIGWIEYLSPFKYGFEGKNIKLFMSFFLKVFILERNKYKLYVCELRMHDRTNIIKLQKKLNNLYFASICMEPILGHGI